MSHLDGHTVIPVEPVNHSQKELPPTMLITLEHASIGHPITRSGVSLFPVFIRQTGQVITTGPSVGVQITERPDAEVPTLQVHNPTPNPVLLVEGETVTGGRQSRTLNVSVLVPAGATIDIPVSCVEQGRWSGGHEFGRGRMMASRRVRRAKEEGVLNSIRHSGTKFSDQSEVWHVISSELERKSLHNPTGSFIEADNMFDRDDAIGAAADELIGMGPRPGQCGVVISHGRRVVAADVFANADMFACQWEAVVRAALFDAPDEARGTPSATKALQFLRRFADSKADLAPGVGLGREHHVSAKRVVGQALVWDDVLVHASVFAVAA